MTEPTPAPSVVADAHRIISDAEAEIKGLALKLRNRIDAIIGDVEALPRHELTLAKQSVDHAIAWVQAHFDKIA